jgi:hypothetical protein
MKNVYSLMIICLLAGFVSPEKSRAEDNSRYLVLNFDCHGEAVGKSAIIGDSLRASIRHQGGMTVSRDLIDQVIKQKNLNESDLNYILDDLEPLISATGADGAVFGHVFSSRDLFTIEMRYLAADTTEPILFDPLVCGSIPDIFAVMPEMARIILSPDKIPPIVVSVEPADGQTDVGDYVDMKIKFSEPMNPETYSLSGKPEMRWRRFGDVVYEEGSNLFIIKVYLYRDTDYEFHINGEDSKGFKDAAGNPAREYIWTFSTGK